MAGESITFDFVGRNADKLAQDFRKTGDNAALAAKGARLCADALDKQRKAASTSVDATLALAKADSILKDAEDGLRDGALEAELALKRQAAAEKDAAAAALLDAEAQKKAAQNRKDALSSLKAPSVAGVGTLLAPSLIPAIGTLLPAVGAVTASLAGAGLAAGAFGALAATAFSGASADATKLAALQQKLSDATTAKQRQAIQTQITDLEKGWSASYTQLVTATGKIETQWKGLAKSVATPVLAPWLSAASEALTHLRPLVQPVADDFRSWGQDLNRYFASRAGSSELTRIATALGQFGAGEMSAIGVFLSDSGKSIFNLGRDLASHNVDFGAFSLYLDQWGGAFLRWSQSAAARRDVSAFLAWVHANGPVVTGLLKNLGNDLALFAPGLSSAGSNELKLISDFLGFIGHLPPNLAKPLTDDIGALLLLKKIGVISLGIKVAGPALKWLSGGLINIGGGATVAAEIRAAFTSGGAAAAAEIRAAMAGGEAAGGAGGISGGAAAGATAGKAAGGGFLAAFRAALGPASAGVITGALIRAVGDTLSPKGTFAGNLNKNFQDDGHLWSTSLLHSFTFGGLEGWLTAKIGLPVGKALNDIASGAKIWGGNVTKTVTGAFSSIAGGAKTWWGDVTGTVSRAWGSITGSSSAGSKAVQNAFGAAGRAADALRTRNLTPLLGDAGKVSGGIQGLAGTITGRFNSAVNSGGSHVNAFRTQNLGPLQGSLSKTTGGVQGLQHYINLLHGKTVAVGVTGSGSGGVVITTSGIAAAGQGNVRFHAARGAYVSTGTGPTADDNLARVSKGELIVPARMVSSGAVDHLRGRIPGFAAGGFVGVENALGQASGVAASYEGRGAAAAMAAGVKAAIAREKAAITKAASVGNYKPGAGVGQWRGVVQQALGLAGANVAQLTDPVLYQMQTECVTLDAVILTRRGWLKHDAVQPGDETIGYNPATGLSEWTAVTAVRHYDAAPTVRYGNQYWNAEFTPNHRWLAERVVRRPAGQQPLGACPECSATGGQRGPFQSQRALQIHRAREHAVAGARHGAPTAEVTSPPELIRFEDRERSHRLILARKADTGPGLPITEREAHLLGWIAGDGDVQRQKEGWLGVNVYQSKLQFFSAIDYACGADPRYSRHAERASRGPNRKPTTQWHITSAYARDLFARAGDPKTGAVAMVLAMSASQRNAWLEAVLLSEGSWSDGKITYWQNAGEIADAIEIAVYLEGHRPGRSERARAGKARVAIIEAAPHIGGPSRRDFTEDAGVQPVWCVTTELGTWTARNASGAFLTGNSGGNPTIVNRTDSNWLAGHPSVGLMQVIRGTFASYAGRFRSTGPFEYGVSVNPLANVYSAIKYAQSAYGPGLRNAYGGIGTGHGYDKGGWLMPGTTLAVNNTGRPEQVIPPGGTSAGSVHLHLTVNAPIGSQQQLEDWFIRVANKTAQHGRLTQAVKTANR